MLSAPLSMGMPGKTNKHQGNLAFVSAAPLPWSTHIRWQDSMNEQVCLCESYVHDFFSSAGFELQQTDKQGNLMREENKSGLRRRLVSLGVNAVPETL